MTLEEELRAARPPDAEAAEARAWALLRAGTPPAPPRRPAWPVWSLALGALLAALIAAGAGRPGDAVGDWVRRALAPAPAPPAPPPARFPGGGMVLASGAKHTAIVRADGPVARLRPFAGVAWSPRERFVAGYTGGTLRAVDRRDRTRWLLRASGTISAAAWSPDGFRIAYYASGAGVRVVAGDGTGDHPYGPRATEPVLAWRPGAPHTLAVVDRRGRIDVRDVDTARLVYRSTAPVGRHTKAMAWSADGRHLALAGGGRLTLIDVRTGDLHHVLLPFTRRRVDRAVDVAWAPRRRALAVLLRSRAGSRVVVMDRARIGRTGFNRLVGDERLAWPVALDRVAWSPDGRWLLASWPATRQWLFMRASGPRPVALRAAPRTLGEAPSVAGWRR